MALAYTKMVRHAHDIRRKFIVIKPFEENILQWNGQVLSLQVLLISEGPGHSSAILKHSLQHKRNMVFRIREIHATETEKFCPLVLLISLLQKDPNVTFLWFTLLPLYFAIKEIILHNAVRFLRFLWA